MGCKRCLHKVNNFKIKYTLKPRTILNAMIMLSQNIQKLLNLKYWKAQSHGCISWVVWFYEQGMQHAAHQRNKDNKNQPFCLKRKLKPNYPTNYAISLLIYDSITILGMIIPTLIVKAPFESNWTELSFKHQRKMFLLGKHGYTVSK